MPREIETGVQPSVRFSRVLGLHSVVALGASISVGLGVYVLLGLLSVLAHGVSANPAIKRYTRQVADLQPDAPKYAQKDLTYGTRS
jgi:hypothetical protein